MDYLEGEILYFNKPLTWTSFNLVAKVRNTISKKLKIKKIKIGHAGTLDPLATGVMIICTGKATKRIEEFQYLTKEYIATLELGATTASFDLEHPVDQRMEFSHITREAVEETLKKFIGRIEQIPPAYSACKIDGRRAYKMARNGEEVILKPKVLVIDEIELLDYELPLIKIRVVCSKGTYIRALARDLGVSLGCGAHLTALCRTRIGNIGLEDCLNFNNFIQSLKTIDSELSVKTDEVEPEN